MPDSSDSADIETGADTLLSFLEEKTKWPVSKIADEMGVPEKTVKAWAKALEKSGLVDIKYSALKGMVLEYASDKSYEELNEGRSELALEADELEIEVDEVDVEDREKSGTKEVEHVEDQAEQGEEESQEEEPSETNDSEEDSTSQNKDEEDSEEALDNGVDVFENPEDENSEDPDSLDKAPEDMSAEEGKEKLKNELENLEEKKKKRKKPEKASLKAEKAKIKKSKGKEDSSTEKGEKNKEWKKINDREEHKEALDRVHDHVSSESSKEVEHSTGESFYEVIDNIEDLGSLLGDEDVDNSEVYSQLQQEMDELKNILEEEDITDEMKGKVFEAMNLVEGELEDTGEEKGLSSRLIAKLRGIFP